MANYQNSSISEWLYYNGTIIGSPKSCQVNGKSDTGPLVDVACSAVCNSSRDIMTYTPQNIVTCGQWAWLVLAWNSTSLYNGPAIPAAGPSTFPELLHPFESVGLDAVNSGSLLRHTAVIEALAYGAIISGYLYSQYNDARLGTSNVDLGGDNFPTVCTSSILFSPTLDDQVDGTVFFEL